MTERWEYATVVWTYSREKRPDPLGTRWWSEFSVRLPDEAEARTYLASDSTDETADTKGFTALINELGSEGWEIITETVMESMIAHNVRGFPEAGVPVEVRWTLKRRHQAPSGLDADPGGLAR